MDTATRLPLLLCAAIAAVLLAAPARAFQLGTLAGRDTGTAQTPKSAPAPQSTPAAATTVAAAIERSDAAFRAADFKLARDLLVAQSAEKQTAKEKARLLRRVERLDRAEAFLRSVATAVEKTPAAYAGVEVAARDGSFTGRIAGAKDGKLGVEVDGAVREVEPLALATPGLLALAAREKPASVQDAASAGLDRAFFCLCDANAKETDAALRKAAESQDLKASIDSAVAFLRNIDDVPEWGFFRFEDRWVTFKERAQRESKNTVVEVVARLGRSEGKAYEQALADLAEQLVVAKPDVIAALKERRQELRKDFLAQPELANLAKLQEHKAELDKARAFAFELINDEVKYFYPYRADEVGAEKAALYPKVSHEVDERVEAVRKIWGDEHQPMGVKDGAVVLSKKFRKLLHSLESERGILAAAVEGGFPLEPDLAVCELLPLRDDRITLRNIASDGAERIRLDEDEKVLTYNASGKPAADVDAIAEVLLTNDYRRMMGRGALAINDKLQRAATGHSEWMSKVGKLSHFEDDPALHDPGDRMAAQGYTNGAGENCAIANGASGAHEGWCHSSGHHRNMLQPTHREIGVGGAGNYWTQNYGGSAEYRGNQIGD